MSRHEFRASASKEVNALKSELISNAYKRIERAQALGFHIEAVAIIESLISDRLESAIANRESMPIKVSNLGPALNQLLQSGFLTHDLAEEISSWGRNRAKVVHEMVKVTVVQDSNWKERMRFAKYVSIEGFRLLLVLDSLVKEHKKRFSHNSKS